MTKKGYFPRTLEDLLTWLELQVAQWNAHFAAFGLTTAQRDALVADIQAQIDTINTVIKLQKDVAQAEDKRDEALRVFTDSYRAQVKQYKNTIGVDRSLFTAFGWDGPTHGKPDPDTTRPRIIATHQSPAVNTIDFVRGPFDGVDVETSTDGSTWAKGDFDTRSPTTTPAPTRSPACPSGATTASATASRASPSGSIRKPSNSSLISRRLLFTAPDRCPGPVVPRGVRPGFVLWVVRERGKEGVVRVSGGCHGEQSEVMTAWGVSSGVPAS